MTLPYDICRCHDHDCPEKDSCLRYLDRDTNYIGTVHCATHNSNHEKNCDYKIPTKTIDKK